eukprot:6231468-Prymnesium_polylepis.1
MAGIFIACEAQAERDAKAVSASAWAEDRAVQLALVEGLRQTVGGDALALQNLTKLENWVVAKLGDPRRQCNLESKLNCLITSAAMCMNYLCISPADAAEQRSEIARHLRLYSRVYRAAKVLP